MYLANNTIYVITTYVCMYIRMYVYLTRYVFILSQVVGFFLLFTSDCGFILYVAKVLLIYGSKKLFGSLANK